MVNSLKKIIVNALTLLAVAVGVLLVAVGYSDRIPPATHTVVACAGMAMPAMLVLNMAMLLVMLSIRWRRAWIPLAAFIAVYGPIRTYLPLHLPAKETAGKEENVLRILTYNVCGYGGNFKYDNALDTILAYVQAQDADVVCIQEEQCTKFKTAERWKEHYPYNDTAIVSKDKSKMLNAIGIHSRLPIVKREAIEYDSQANGSMAYWLLWGSDTIIVVNNHLETTHLTDKERKEYSEIIEGNKERQEIKEELFTLMKKIANSMVKRAPEAEAVRSYVETHRLKHPIVVCGDFNDTPISYTHHTMAQGLTDCFAEAGCGLGLSYNRKGFNFRIDHIFCSTHFTPIACKVDSKMDASDHYPVTCSMKMSNKR